MYRITIARSAFKELDKIAEPYHSAIQEKIDRLSANPFPQGSRKLQGHRTLWRVRIADYRVVYAIDPQQLLLDIVSIEHRSSVYRQL